VKLVLYRDPDGAARPGALSAGGVRSLERAVSAGLAGQAAMVELIDGFQERRAEIEAIVEGAPLLALDRLQLLPPLPRPGKILGCIGNYWEHAERDPRPVNMFLKNPDAVIGPGDTIRLPEFAEPWIFMHEAELALVIRGPASRVPAERWRDAVFGYTCLIDVSARGEGRSTWRAGSWLGKSFDTFCPLGPCIVTADEIPDPNKLRVKFWNDGELRHDYSTDDMEHPVPELIEFATTVMTLNSGDVIACGTNHEGLGALQHGESVTIAIDAIGEMSLEVVDPLRRSWPRGVYLGADSTNQAASARQSP
jgi:2-keto-4-pentenoate hydratase/2-oxohepta-3-ene-1,7-dioic acid hydratase in catechol pathway